MNVSGHVPLSRCSAALYDALTAAGLHEGRVNLPACLLKLAQHAGSDVNLALRMVNELGPEWAARMLIRQDDPDVPSVDVSLLHTLLDDHADADNLDYWRSASLLHALLGHPALQHHGAALVPRLAALPAARRELLLNQVRTRSGENTPPCRFELDDPAYQAEYLLTTAREIQALLEANQRQHASLILRVDDDAQGWPAQWVSLSDTQLTLRLLAPVRPLDAVMQASRLVADTAINQIKVQFALTEASVRRYGADVYIDAPLPLDVLRLQRRDHYRLKLGRAGSLHCQLELWLSDGRGHRHRVQVQVQDLSSGGVGFVMDASQPELAPGTRLDDCQLMLDDGCHRVDLLVCNRAHRPPPRPAWHYGCEFLNPPPPLVAQLDHEIMRQTALLR